jgi:hypothetical protein
MTLAEQIAALATKSVAELAADYAALFGKAPRSRHAAWLRKRIAFQMQVAVHGGMASAARAALDRLTAEIELPPAPTADAGDRLRPGTVLQREWRGQQIRVQVLADGFEWNGNVYGSLSAVANAITGTRWNGRLFFNLVERAKA